MFLFLSLVLTHPIRPITRHTSSKNNRPLRPQPNKRPRCRRRTIPRPEHIQLKQLLHLRHAKLQRRLVPRHARVGNHAVEAALGLHHSLERPRDAVLAGHVRVQVGELRRVLCLHGGEVWARGADVQGVDFGGAVGEADFGEAEADALVCSCDLDGGRG